MIAAGRVGTPDSRLALETLCAAYWPPLYVYARRRGASREEAEDQVQGFFAEFLARGAVGVADPARGRFRSFLLTSFRNHVEREREKRGAAKRGGRARAVPLDPERCEADLRNGRGGPGSAEDAYHREWALTVLERVLSRLREAYETRGKGAVFDAMKGFLDGSAGDESRAERAEKLGMADGAFRVALHRLRERYQSALVEEIAGTLPDGETPEDEIRGLFRALGS